MVERYALRKKEEVRREGGRNRGVSQRGFPFSIS